MSIIVKGMKMPDDCPVCPLAHWNKLDSFTGCELIKRYFDKADMETRGRPSFCPLVELPAEHGRLIDADALKDTLDYYIREAGWSDEINEALTWVRDEFIDHEPTVIEAEGVSE